MPRSRRLPGDPGPKTVLHRLIRVDHAGEYGAQRIYEGQLAILGRSKVAPTLQHMAEQEQAHLARFEGLIRQNRVRPTALLPFWHVAGFALGAGTALLGERAAMACTVAVEEVIEEHYQAQADAVEAGKAGDAADLAGLTDTIKQFQAEEAEHRDIGLEHEAEKTPGYRLLSGVIKAGSKAAIFLSERV